LRPVRVVSAGVLILYMVEMLSTNLLQSDRNADAVSNVVIVSKNETVVLLTPKYMKRKGNSVMLVKKQRLE
jgi:hypothetical protein